ncbi:MAG: hypothetical protein JW893_08585 [Candidatus Omnitrophica bacterium]|nr:hypothetical protein [Candidatus Omnitrophota bacterium]
MNYTQSLRYLNSFLNLERILYSPKNRLWNLKRMDYLLKWGKAPNRSFFPVVIAGTKGKGSTGFFLESILRASGIPVGFYSSPHLESPRERIRLNGRVISVSDWTRGVQTVQRTLKGHRLPSGMGAFTYFEIMTFMAMLVFREKKIRAGIFEVGMGGRLDAVNVLRAPLSIITPIAMDHEALLGKNLQAIACEKAGVIHKKADVITGPQKKEAMKGIHARVKKMKAYLWKAKPLRQEAFSLAGDFHQVNGGLASEAARVLRESYGFSQISKESVRCGLKAEDWPGRMEYFKRGPRILLDAAHNPASMEALVRNLKRQHREREVVLIFGSSRDKNAGEMFKILSRYFSKVIVTRTPNPRSQEIHELLVAALPYFDNIIPVSYPLEALKTAGAVISKNGLIVVTGSFYLLGELRKHVKNPN